MKVDVEVDTKSLTFRLKGIRKALPNDIDRALKATAMQGINIILDRTAEGIGYKGGAFDPYSEQYAKFRAKNGRKTAPPDLNYTGRMTSSIASKRVRQGVQKIYFTRSTEARKAYYNNIKRPFFGLSVTEKSRLMAFIKGRLLRK